MVGDFKREIKSINSQFFIFLISYLTKLGYVGALMFFKVSQDTFDLLYFVLAFVCMFIPCFAILLLHHLALYPRIQGQAGPKLIEVAEEEIDHIHTDNFSFVSDREILNST